MVKGNFLFLIKNLYHSEFPNEPKIPSTEVKLCLFEIKKYK